MKENITNTKREDYDAVIILAAGQGKRMGSTDRHKVCFPIGGRPAIVRAIDDYKKAGLKRFIVVVGQMAGQVMETVSAEHPEVTFVFQSEARGTGHAAAIGCGSLAAAGFKGNVLITMGDKVVDPAVITELRESFEREGAALTMVTLPFKPGSSAGRVVLEGERGVLGIVEKKDLDRAEQSGRSVRLGSRSLSVDEIDTLSARANGSVYLFRFPVLWDALNILSPDNEQGELYLTDTVGILRDSGRPVSLLDVADRERVMAYNTPAELIAIEEVLARREAGARVQSLSLPRVSPEQLKPASEWREVLAEDTGPLRDFLTEIYGTDAELIGEQRAGILAVVGAFIERYGPDRPMVLCRAPGRINLMGRHIEHRGGDINVMAISRETFVAAAPREDDVVELHSLAADFPERSFRITDLLRNTSWEDWIDFIDSSTVRQVLTDAPGDWSHYARAPLLRLQHECSRQRLFGMDCVVSGNIPMGAGLSSSSSLVVAFAEIAITFNGLAVETGDFIDLCGEGEWFVGSRGGNGDHAAIRAGRIGAISRIGSFPFSLKQQVPLPENLRVVIADSGVEARKSAGARDAFNHRIAAYRIGQKLLQKTWPAAAGAEHLRDLCPHRLMVHPSDLYRALKDLPELPDRVVIRDLFARDEQPFLDRIFATHAEIAPYDLRGVVLYGLAECLRAERFSELLEAGDLDAIGRMMAISHDGDRVAGRRSPVAGARLAGGGEPAIFSTSNDSLDQFARDEVDLAQLPGSYACSTPEIDELVDRARLIDGVVGAQLSGAGLGGCVMILVERNAIPQLIEYLEAHYYTPRRTTSRIYTCQPVEGAGLLKAPVGTAEKLKG